MMTKLSPREWEAISAYLDGQLAPKERTRLEERMKANPSLRQALDEMRRTRMLLRSQPRMRAPRNFTLTPEMVGARRPARGSGGLFINLRLASALATILLVFVLIGDLFSGAPVSYPMQDTALTYMEQEAQRSAPPGMGGDPEVFSGEAGSAPAPEAAPLEAPAAEPNEAAPPVAQAPEPTGDMAMKAVPVEPEATAEAGEPEASVALAPPAEATPEFSDPGAATAAEDRTQMADGLLAEESPAPLRNQPPGPFGLDRSTLRLLEIVLAVLAVSTGLLAYSLRHR